MSTTLSALRTSTRRFIDETTAGTFSDADLNQYINDSELQLWMELCEFEPSFGLREATMTLTQGEVDILYPADILGRNIRGLWTYSASDTERRKVSPAEYEELMEEGQTQNNYPKKYFPMDGYIKIGPPPDGSNNTLRILYVRKPTPMSTDGETMDSDDAFAETVAIGAAMRALERTGVDISSLEKRYAMAVGSALGAAQPNEPRFSKNVWHYK